MGWNHNKKVFFLLQIRRRELGHPIVIKLGGDSTGIIPNMFLDSGTPTASPRLDPGASRAAPAPPEWPAHVIPDHGWVVPKSIGFSRIFREHDFSLPDLLLGWSAPLRSSSFRRRGSSPRGGGIESRGHRRRSRVQKHVGNAASTVPTKFYDSWRSQSAPTDLQQKKTLLYLIEKIQVYMLLSIYQKQMCSSWTGFRKSWILMILSGPEVLPRPPRCQ